MSRSFSPAAVRKWAGLFGPGPTGVRWRSGGGSGRLAQVFELVIEGGEAGGAARRLEDAIHGIMVRRAAPEWLPFVPGSSYWVPPRSESSQRLAAALERAASPLSDEEVMSLTTAWGWPCSSRLLQDLSSESAENKSRSPSDDEES